MQAAGPGLAVLTILAFGNGAPMAPDTTLGLAVMTGGNLLIGRAAGLSFGDASGLGHPMVIGAEIRQPWVRRFGILGLFLFVFVPLWMTFPVVGAVMGFLIGLKPRTDVLVVLSATSVAIVLWGLLLDALPDPAGQVHRYAPVLGTVAVALPVLAARRLTHRA